MSDDSLFNENMKEALEESEKISPSDEHNEEDQEETIDDFKDNIEEELLDYDLEINTKIQNNLKLVDDKQIDFVKNSPGEILNFIQESSRAKRKLVYLRDDIKKAKEHYLVLIKANLQEREAVKSLKTGTERNLAIDNIILNEFNLSFEDNISKLQSRIDFYNDEINLARDIYKLKALVQ